jgi:hypothetical protein
LNSLPTVRPARRLLWATALGAAAAWLLVGLHAAWGLPLWLATLAALAAAVGAPGVLFVEILVGGSAPPPIERAVYSVAAGFALATLALLALSYLPGELSPGTVMVAFGALTLLLLALAFLVQRRPADAAGDGPGFPDAALDRGQRRWLAAGIAVLLGVAALLRLANAGYAEFHGDEARAVLRAAAVIQGYENALFLHRKGPGEILTPVLLFSFTGRITEATARLPFAIANLTALLGVFLLGWRMVGPVAGWSAAFLLTFDGYLIAFSRFVQYQSMVLLASVAAVLIAYRAYRDPRSLGASLGRWLSLCALLLAAGLLHHYDVLLAVGPVGFLLLALLWQRRVAWRALAWGLLPALAVGIGVTALFYLPWSLHPNFVAASDYVLEGRLTGIEGWPRNNLRDVFLRTAFYSSTYYVLLLAALAVASLALAYRRGYGRTAAAIAGTAATAVLAMTLWRYNWLKLDSTDLTALAYALLVGAVWFAPRLRTEERTLWLWFGVPMLATFFAISAPRTHVHIFFVPWALVAGVAVQAAYDRLAARAGTRPARVAGIAAATVAALVFGFYGWTLFADVDAGVAHDYNARRPRFYWAPQAVGAVDALYGLPLNNGWKAIGALYAGGTMQGSFESNVWAEYIPAWYTRGQQLCLSTADWYFAVDGLEPWAEPAAAVEDRVEAGGFERWGVVESNGAPRMAIYAQPGAGGDAPGSIPLAPLAAQFDAQATPYFPLAFPAVQPAPSVALHADMSGMIWLEGYDLDLPAELRPGDTIRLTLYWRAQQRNPDPLTVTNQAYYGDGTMVVHKDAVPACDRRPTERWRPGEEVVDAHDLTIMEGTPPGVYPLYTALYHPDTGARVPVLDAAGNVIDDKVKVGDLNVVAP